MRFVVPLLDGGVPRRILSAPGGRRVATVQAFDWPGLLLEAGHNDVTEVDELVLAHHYVGLNTDSNAITLEVKGPHGYRPVRLEPGAGWVAPAGHAVSLRVRNSSDHAYVRLSFDPMRFERLVHMGADRPTPLALRPTFGIGGPQMQHLVGALVAEAGGATPNGLAFVEAITTALGLQLLEQAGDTPGQHDRARGGLAPAARRRVLELMSARPDARLSIETLACEAGLSAAHFARAFKESTGRAPHQHLVELRLDLARRMLDAPDAVLSDVALRAGFADQAHLTRFFKRRFGITPGALVRASRR